MISYSKINDISPTQVRETDDYMSSENNHTIPYDSELYLESSKLYEDSNGNLWAKSPLNNFYYEVYRKSVNKTLIHMYPTMYATITADCKSGLALYERHDFSSKEILRKKAEETFEITSDFFVDDRKNIWVRSINLIRTEHGYKKNEGWVVYKTRRNNFLNLYIHGKFNVLTMDGELDEDKVAEFSEYIGKIAFKDFYAVAEPLQLFATKMKTKSVKTGNKNSVETEVYWGYKQAHSRVGFDGTVVGTESRRGYYPFAGRGWYPNKGGKVSQKLSTDVRDPSIVQNSARFPSIDSYKKEGKTKVPVYNYYMDYDQDGVNSDLVRIRQNMNYSPLTSSQMYKTTVAKYNRFKLANPSDILSRGFAHVFFTRPDCNIFKDNVGSQAVAKVETNPNFKYALCNKKELLYNLTQVSTSYTANPAWNWILSNKALSFSLTDESINVDKYGTTYGKNSIAYGKSNEESKAAGEFNITFQDTRDLDIFHIHKLWVDYISNVYIGRWYPKQEYLWQRIIDYACSVYYIITAEDGETILFWSKYYGCFPTNIPSSSYGWSAGSPIESQRLDLTYQYSFKEDYNPQSLVELNLNTGIDPTNKIEYVATYNPTIGAVGTTWVGSPFIETVKDEGTDSYSFKLRFRRGGY